ncbi:hypothetical protein Q7P36_004043 [Cladosporium allicinum]
MDFLRIPDNCTHIKTPDLGGEEYDGLEFMNYGARMGWNIQQLRRGNVLAARVGSELDQSTATEWQLRAAQFVQTWLYFGLLTEVLEMTIQRHSFTMIDESGQSYLASAALGPLLQTCITAIRGSPPIERHRRLCRFKAVIDTSAHFLKDLRVAEKDRSSFLPFETDLCLTSLAYFLSFWLVKQGEDYNAIWAYGNHGSALERRLLEEGCCANMIERISMNLGPPGLYYYSILHTQPETRDHIQSGCTWESCAANTVDEKTYLTRHATSCDLEFCPNLGAPSSLPADDATTTTLQSILDAQCIPLVDLSADLKRTSGTPRISLITRHLSEHGDQRPFIAISHVWADGFGNQNANALPQCVLRALKQRVRALAKTHGLKTKNTLWMDTLCVPTEPQKSRDTAIMAMQKTYEMAEAVLVLDGSLFSIDAPVHQEECLVRIMCSAWMSRLWTFQEAWSAHRIMFQFKDRTLELNDLLWETKRLPKFDPARFLCERARRVLEATYGLVLSPPHTKHGPTLGSLRGRIMFTSRNSEPHVALRRHWKSLRYRNTSREKDIPVCLATLIGLEPASILQKESMDDRMEAFWTLQNVVGSAVLWLPGPRLQRPAFRWAPRNLLHPDTQSGSLRIDCPLAEPTSAGLKVQGLPAVQLHDAWTRKDETSNFSFVDRFSGVVYYVWKQESPKQATWESLRLHDRTELYILLSKRLTSDGWVSGNLLSGSQDVGCGIRSDWLALVTVYQENGTYDMSMAPRDRPAANKDAWVSADQISDQETWIIS